MALETTLERKLLEIAEKANKLINKKIVNGEEIDESDKAVCSIYLIDYHYGKNRYVLRASTKPSPLIELDSIIITEEKKDNFEKGQLQNIGLTIYTILSKKGISTPSLITDPRWSNYGCSEDEIRRSEEVHYCEFTYKELGGIIIVPIFSSKSEREEVIGVIRIVNKKDNKIKYGDEELKKLENIIKQETLFIELITSYSSLIALIKIGAFWDLKVLCSESAKIINDIMQGKGCSIFLLDEENSTQERKIYRCFGTTGLAYKNERGDVEEIKDPYNDEKAIYTYEPKTLEEYRPKLSLTVGVIRARENVFIDDLFNQEEIDKQFTEKFKIERKAGVGKSCEYYLDKDTKEYVETCSLMITPLFYREKSSRRTDVLGVIRIARPKGSAPFNLYEKHLFIWMAEELSRVIIKTKYIEMLDELTNAMSINELFLKIVKGIPKILGGSNCAIFIKDEVEPLLIQVAGWNEGQVRFFEEREGQNYDLSQPIPAKLGYTGYVAYYETILRFNNPKELEKLNPKPTHRKVPGIEPPIKFLGVPIYKKEGNKSVLFGVIRICKRYPEETDFTEDDEKILSRLAQTLWFEIARLQRTEETNLLIAAVDHEITPFLYPLFRNIEDKNFEKALDIAKKIGGIIENLHNYRTGALIPIKWSKCNINDLEKLIEEMLNIYKEEIDKKGIKWKINTTPYSKRDINIDKDKIGIVFRNLISNSIEAIGDKEGKIDISISMNEKEDTLQITFKDNGCGMRESVKNDLLKKFVSSKPGKMGVGLYLSKHIIKMHKGKFSFESEYGKGSTFFIELPCILS